MWASVPFDMLIGTSTASASSPHPGGKKWALSLSWVDGTSQANEGTSSVLAGDTKHDHPPGGALPGQLP